MYSKKSRGDVFMSGKEILTEIIIPLIAGFFGGSIGNIAIEKHRLAKKHKMNNKMTSFNNDGDVINGDKK